ncbi:hypothetical protein PS903_02470 [Pseudomonas fluorescens]|nr:hypothetical protein PS903_02470 [Pseudomonas fluorescens]
MTFMTGSYAVEHSKGIARFRRITIFRWRTDYNYLFLLFIFNLVSSFLKLDFQQLNPAPKILLEKCTSKCWGFGTSDNLEILTHT